MKFHKNLYGVSHARPSEKWTDMTRLITAFYTRFANVPKNGDMGHK